MNDTLRVKKIKPSNAKSIIDTRKPSGLYYLRVNDVYIGIDNSTGHAWTEEFQNLKHCKKWLRDSSVVNEADSPNNYKCRNFNVVITETLKLTVEIEAYCKEEAEQIVSDAWKNSDYILDACAFHGVTFEAVLLEK